MLYIAVALLLVHASIFLYLFDCIYLLFSEHILNGRCSRIQARKKKVGQPEDEGKIIERRAEIVDFLAHQKVNNKIIKCTLNQ